jgi:hypothetical protein
MLLNDVIEGAVELIMIAAHEIMRSWISWIDQVKVPSARPESAK